MKLLHTLVDVFVVAAAAGGMAIGLAVYRADLAENASVDATRAALMTIHSQIGIRALLAETPINEHGFPVSIDPSWFEGGEPRNPLGRDDAPWIEIAREHEATRAHPTIPTFRNGRGAMFWYNPNSGVIRARVPEQTTDQASRALYERVNGSVWE